MVCRPAWRLNTMLGCPHHCVYCAFGELIPMYVNMGAYCERLVNLMAANPWQQTYLYDDAADPFQLRNLVADPASKGVVAELHAMVQDWLAQTNDPFETSEQIADRLCPGHVNCVLPNPPLEEAIRLGQRERMLQRAAAAQV